MRGRPRIHNNSYERILNNQFTAYKRDSTRKSVPIEFNLRLETFEELLFGDCYYCKSPPQHEEKGYDDEIILRNGIDRVDNTLGYFKDNCVSCCMRCNFVKGLYKIDELDDVEYRIQLITSGVKRHQRETKMRNMIIYMSLIPYYLIKLYI